MAGTNKPEAHFRKWCAAVNTKRFKSDVSGWMKIYVRIYLKPGSCKSGTILFSKRGGAGLPLNQSSGFAKHGVLKNAEIDVHDVTSRDVHVVAVKAKDDPGPSS